MNRKVTVHSREEIREHYTMMTMRLTTEFDQIVVVVFFPRAHKGVFKVNKIDIVKYMHEG